jgi:hypothetical protein
MLPFASFPRHTALIIIAQIEATADQPHQAKAHPRSDQEQYMWRAQVWAPVYTIPATLQKAEFRASPITSL